MTKEQEQLAKNVHLNFLAMPETIALIHNLKKQLEQEVYRILNHSVLDTMSDAQIRNLCARAHATKELLNYVTKEPKSIIGTRE